MNYLKDPNFLRQVIMDHYQYPRNKKVHDDYKQMRISTDSCIDDITVYAKIDDGVISDISFFGEACTIATSSVSMMSELLKGKRIDDAHHFIGQFNAMLKMQAFDEELMGEAIALRNVSRQPHRIHCADLGWRALSAILEKENQDE